MKARRGRILLFGRRMHSGCLLLANSICGMAAAMSCAKWAVRVLGRFSCQRWVTAPYINSKYWVKTAAWSKRRTLWGLGRNIRPSRHQWCAIFPDMVGKMMRGWLNAVSAAACVHRCRFMRFILDHGAAVGMMAGGRCHTKNWRGIWCRM